MNELIELHHLGYRVPDIDEKGFSLLQSGRGPGKDGTGAYAHFDIEPAFGCIVEAIEMPAGEIADPERIYPE